MEEPREDQELNYRPLSQNPDSPKSGCLRPPEAPERQVEDDSDDEKVPDDLNNIPVNVRNYVFVKDPLFELGNAVSAIIEEQPEWLSELSTCELSTRHHISVETEMGQKYLYKSKEISGCCSKIPCCGKIKDFEIVLTHVKNLRQYSSDLQKEKATVRISKNFVGVCCSNERINVELTDKNGKTERKIRCVSFCDNTIKIYNEEDKNRYNIIVNNCQLGYICSKCEEVIYYIYSATDNSKPLGEIYRRAFTMNDGCCSYANIYKVNFPLNANNMDKLLLICSVLIISSQFYYQNLTYEKKSQNKNKEI